VALPFSEARLPALLALANGVPVAGAIEAHVTSTGCHAADRFELRVASSADPMMGLAFWADAASVQMNIRFSGGTGFQSAIVGNADTITLDPLAGTVCIGGRDLSAGLIESPTQETFANRTSSEIAAILAVRHGLGAVVQPTTTMVGRYWELEHDHITLNQFSRTTTEWDLLVGLAEREGFDVWVAGQTLFFQPPSAEVLPGATISPVATPGGPANVTRLRLERALTLARPLNVSVKSWNSRMAQGFVQTASVGGSAGGTAAQYSFVLPNLTPDVAMQIAQQRLQELVRHERVVSAEMPGEMVISAHGPVALVGTGTAFDQTYWVDEIVRSIDVRQGFRQMLRARNASSGTAVL
jgi:phage protein D